MHAHSNNDRELFRLISEGDEPAFRLLFRKYVPELRPLILHLTKTAAVTGTGVQGAYAARHAGQYCKAMEDR